MGAAAVDGRAVESGAILLPVLSAPLVGLLGLLQGQAGPPERAPFREPTTDELAGHRAQLERLEEIRRSTGSRNGYLGTGYLRRLEDARKDLSPTETSPKVLAKFGHEVGLQLLRLGRTPEALAELERCRAWLEPIPRADWPPFAWRLHYDLAIACLRLAETSNCVAHHTSESCLLPIQGGGVHVDETGSRGALRWLRATLADARERTGQTPEGASWEDLGICARWLLNLAAMTVGEWPDGVEEEWRIAPEVFASRAEFPRFPEAAGELGLAVNDLSGGAILEDFDADGDLDVLTSTWDTSGAPTYLENEGGRFVDRTAEKGLAGLYGGLNLVQADFDDDGWTDVLVLRGAWLLGERGQHPRSLLQNRAGRRFLDVTLHAGLGDDRYPTQAAGFADADLDGDLDLYVASEASLGAPFPGQLYENRGDGTFDERAADAGVENLRYAKGVSWGDVDQDGDPDLYVSNLGSDNRLYENRGELSFADVAAERGVTRPLDSFATWFFDHDNDGLLDLYAASYPQLGDDELRVASIVRGTLGLPGAGESPRLYRGDGRGGFRDVTEATGLGRPSMTMGANFGDLDGDGYLDVYLGTGYPGYDGLVPNVLYWNRAGRRFDDVTTAAGVGHLQKGHGVAFGDLDGDGDLDLFEQMGGAYPGDAYRNAFYRNPGFGNRWVELELVGTRSVRSAIGARIRVDVVAGEEARSIFRWVNSGGSFGCSPLLQHVGLGRAERIERIVVDWPGSRTSQEVVDVPLDSRIRVVEGVETTGRSQ